MSKFNNSKRIITLQEGDGRISLKDTELIRHIRAICDMADFRFVNITRTYIDSDSDIQQSYSVDKYHTYVEFDLISKVGQDINRRTIDMIKDELKCLRATHDMPAYIEELAMNDIIDKLGKDEKIAGLCNIKNTLNARIKISDKFGRDMCERMLKRIDCAINKVEPRYEDLSYAAKWEKDMRDFMKELADLPEDELRNLLKLKGR